MYITGEFKESAKTDIIHGIDNVVNTLSQFISNTNYKIDVVCRLHTAIFSYRN